MEAHLQLANRYFAYLSERFPVMCASDEFHFVPRAQDAVKYYDRMEILAKDDVREIVSSLMTFKEEIERLENQENGLQTEIDLKLLGASVTGVIAELKTNQTWRHNPLLYLKIAFIGLDHAITKPFSEPDHQKRKNTFPSKCHSGAAEPGNGEYCWCSGKLPYRCQGNDRRLRGIFDGNGQPYGFI